MSKCPDCDGKGETSGLVNTGMDNGKHYFGTSWCLTCGGKGEIKGRTDETIAAGLYMKRKRIDEGLTLGAKAQMMGISAAKLSKLERGIPT